MLFRSGLIIKERHFPRDSKLMYKSASGCMEHINIFQVSNINSTLKNLREKNFWVYGFEAKFASFFMRIFPSMIRRLSKKLFKDSFI